MSPNRKYFAVIAIVLMLLMLIASSGCDNTENKASASEQKKDVVKKVLTVKPEVGELSLTLTQGVTLAPEESGSIAAEVTGMLKRWHVKENDYIKKGAPIVTLDDTDYLISLEQAKAGLAAYEAQLASLAKDFERMSALLEGGSIPQSKFDAIEAQKIALENQIKSAKNNITLLKRRAAKTVVRAPYNGVVTTKIAPLGKYVMATMPGGGDVAMMEKIDRLKVSLSISEMYFGEVHQGDNISLFIPTLNKTITATIDSKGMSIGAMKTFRLIAYVDNSAKEIPAGVFAVATIKTDNKQRTIVPPTSVKTIGNRMGEVFTVIDGKVVARPIFLGFAFEQGLEVSGDLPEFVIKDISTVKPGEKVTQTK